MSRYIPMPAYPDMMPVDISFVFEDEKPAGKHGFTVVDGENMRFEDGTLARFWGVNFNGGACFPSHEYAKQVAARLAVTSSGFISWTLSGILPTSSAIPRASGSKPPVSWTPRAWTAWTIWSTA